MTVTRLTSGIVRGFIAMSLANGLRRHHVAHALRYGFAASRACVRVSGLPRLSPEVSVEEAIVVVVEDIPEDAIAAERIVIARIHVVALIVVFVEESSVRKRAEKPVIFLVVIVEKASGMKRVKEAVTAAEMSSSVLGIVDVVAFVIVVVVEESTE